MSSSLRLPVFALLLYGLLAIAVHWLIVRFWWGRVALPRWYRRRGRDWLPESGSRVDHSLEQYVRGRYVDRHTVKPLSCDDGYLHPFLFTDRGVARIVRLSNTTPMSVLSQIDLPYATVKPYTLREYQTACLGDETSNWTSLFRPLQPPRPIPISALRRYTCDVSFAPMPRDQAPTPRNPVATSIDDDDDEKTLRFRFGDTMTGRTYDFWLPEYTSSRNAANTTPIVGLARSPAHRTAVTTARSLDQRNQRSVLLDRDGGAVEPLQNPCWDSRTNQFRVGTFPVHRADYDAIYLRGLQRTDLGNDPATIARRFRQLFWRCVWDDPDVKDNAILSLHDCSASGEFRDGGCRDTA